jgi:hypothetical protein
MAELTPIPQDSDARSDENEPASPAAPASEGIERNAGDGEPPNQDIEPPSGSGFWKWFQENNPLYLLSLLCMFGGLYLAGKAGQEGASIATIVGFFGVQNVYEIIALMMGLYLLTSNTHLRHGKILLAFVLILLGDVTFYQFRISAMCSIQDSMAISGGVSLLYWFLAVGKVVLALHVLEITLRWEQIVFSTLALGIVYLGPQFFLVSVYDLNNLAVLQSDQYPQWIVYQIWLLAALIQLPVVVGAFRESPFARSVPHRLVGDENQVYSALLLFPFVMLPIQLMLNVMTDDRLRGMPMAVNYIPYLACGAFLLQAIWRNRFSSPTAVQRFDCMIGVVLLGVAYGSSAGVAESATSYLSVMNSINLSVITLGQIASTWWRQNLFSGGLLLSMVSYVAFAEMAAQTKKAYVFVRELSLTAWSAILMGTSFLTLVIGFMLSLKGSKKEGR